MRAKPNRKHLTKSVVDAAKPSGNDRLDRLIWDADRGKSKGVAGFGLQVKPSGHKSYMLQYRNYQGRVRRMTLGRHGEITVQQARRLAIDARHKVRNGIDPLDEKQERRKSSDDPRTVAQLCGDYLENHAKRVKRSWQEDERRLKLVRQRLGRVALDRLTKSRVRGFVAEVGGKLPSDAKGSKQGKESAYRPYEANRILFLLQKLFNYAVDQGYLPRDFENPAKWKKSERYPEKARKRILRDDERPRLLAAIEEEPNLHHRALFRLLLLTGLRKGEWLEARWSDLDLTGQRLRLPKTKAGMERIVPLSPTTLGILRGLPRCVGNDHIFPAHHFDRYGHVIYRQEGRRMSDPKKQWRRVRRRAGCDDLQVHDLRRTASNVMLKKVANPKAVQKALGHADIETTMRHYVLAEEETQRQAVEALADEMGI